MASCLVNKVTRSVKVYFLIVELIIQYTLSKSYSFFIQQWRNLDVYVSHCKYDVIRQSLMMSSAEKSRKA